MDRVFFFKRGFARGGGVQDDSCKRVGGREGLSRTGGGGEVSAE